MCPVTVIMQVKCTQFFLRYSWLADQRQTDQSCTYTIDWFWCMWQITFSIYLFHQSDKPFMLQYDTIHRLETNKLRNIAKLFAHLLYTDAIPWTCLVCVRLNEEETTSSRYCKCIMVSWTLILYFSFSRIFIKILFQEIAEFLGLPKLNERLKDPYVVCSVMYLY
jgi:hypothetical protein